MTPVTFWTDDKVEALKKLWGNGNSASDIARIIGAKSRNVIIGKAHRLNLRLYRSPADGNIQRRVATQKQIRRVWTADMLVELRRLAGNNMTRPQIAAAMNLPLYTVGKKLMALHISTQAAADADQRRRKQRGFTFPSIHTKPADHKPPTHKPQEGAGPASVTLMQIGPFQCHAVVQDAPRGCMDEAMMCGEPTDGRSYCARHYAEFYRAPVEFAPRPMMPYEFTRRAA